MISKFDTLGFSRAQAIGFLVLIVAVAAAPFGFYRIFLMEVMCFALFAMGANLLMGFVGLLSLGQAAFFGVGAYVAGWTVQNWHLDPALAVVLGGIAAALVGVVFGWLSIRRTEIYFAMITLALGEVARFWAVQNTSFTGGENGIQNIPRGSLFGSIPLGSDGVMYAVVAVVFIVGVLFVHRIVHSPFGQVVKAIRENEPRAVSLGYKPDHYKWIVFILAAFMGGFAGGLKSIVMGIATLSDVNDLLSGLVVLMVLLGGIGTVFGPIVGALIVVAMQYYLSSFGAWVTVIQGSIFIACVLVFRRGVIGELGALLRVPL